MKPCLTISPKISTVILDFMEIELLKETNEQNTESAVNGFTTVDLPAISVVEEKREVVIVNNSIALPIPEISSVKEDVVKIKKGFFTIPKTNL